MRAHGGRLAVENWVAVGTAVTLLLPMDRARGDRPRRSDPVAISRPVVQACP